MTQRIDFEVTDNNVITGFTVEPVGRGPINYNDLESKPAINGVTLVGDVSLEDIGAADAADVSELKSAITINNPGLIPLTFTLTQYKMISGTDGAEYAANASRYASNAVDVENLTKIHLYSAFRGDYGAAFYDEHNAFISGVIAADGYNEQPHLYDLDVPAGAKYFRFTVYVVNLSPADAYIGIPSTHNDFKNYIVALNKNNKAAYSIPFTLANQKMIDGTSGSEYAASTSYSASNQVDVEGLTNISLYSAFSGDYGCAFYDADGVYISGAVSADGYNQQPYTYDLAVPSTAKYFRFTVYSVNMPANRATLKIPTSQTDFVNSIKALKSTKVAKDAPITDMPVYIRRNLAKKNIGPLSKGYICMTADDGTAGLASYTIPMLISKGVPCTFSLLPTSAVIMDATALATVIDAVTNYGCAVAMHGSAQWPTYTEQRLNAYFDDAEAVFASKGLTSVEGAICPGGNSQDTSDIVRCVAGGRYEVLCSGGTNGEISYGDYYCAGARTNIYGIKRCSAISLTEAQYKAAIDYAKANNLIFMPFWHDYSVVDSAAYKAIVEGMIDYALAQGLEFITLGQIATIT